MAINTQQGALTVVIRLVHIQPAVFKQPVPALGQVVTPADDSQSLLRAEPASLITPFTHFTAFPRQLAAQFPAPVEIIDAFKRYHVRTLIGTGIFLASTIKII